MGSSFPPPKGPHGPANVRRSSPESARPGTSAGAKSVRGGVNAELSSASEEPGKSQTRDDAKRPSDSKGRASLPEKKVVKVTASAIVWRWTKRLAVALLVLALAGVLAIVMVIRHYEQDLPSVIDVKSNYRPPQTTRVLAKGSTIGFRQLRRIPPTPASDVVLTVETLDAPRPVSMTLYL